MLPEDCDVLYVNYFGLCDENVERLLQEVPKEKLIIDNSQALFALPSNAMATIYSIRKFIGVPDYIISTYRKFPYTCFHPIILQKPTLLPNS